MQQWTTKEGPEETSILAHMKPDQEYTAALLADICETSHQRISSTLRAVAKGGVIQRYKKEGVKGYVYKSNQLVLNFESEP